MLRIKIISDNCPVRTGQKNSILSYYDRRGPSCRGEAPRDRVETFQINDRRNFFGFSEK